MSPKVIQPHIWNKALQAVQWGVSSLSWVLEPPPLEVRDDQTSLLQSALFQVWTFRKWLCFSPHKVRLPCSALSQGFLHTFSLEKCERQPGKTSIALYVGACLHRMPTDGNILSSLHGAETLHLWPRGTGGVGSLVWHVSLKLHPPLAALLFVTVKLRVSPCVTFLTCTRVH